MRYDFEVTTFTPDRRTERNSFYSLSQALSAARSLPQRSGSIFIAAIHDHVDYGNFYIFLNDTGRAHVMLHEHREFLPVDSSHDQIESDVKFIDESGDQFVVDASLTTSATRAIAALTFWLPHQEKWPEFRWE